MEKEKLNIGLYVRKSSGKEDTHAIREEERGAPLIPAAPMARVPFVLLAVALLGGAASV